MTGQEILDEVRRMLDDEVRPYKWTDTELVNHLNTTLDDIDRVTENIRDVSTADVVDITLVEDQIDYALDSRILEVETARVDGETTFLKKRFTEYMDRAYPLWRTDDVVFDTPTKYVLDYKADTISFYPPPDADIAGTDVNLTVIRTEITPFTTANLGATTPELNSMYHNELPYGVLKRAYLKAGETTFDEKRAATFGALAEILIDKIQRDFIRLNSINQPHIAPHKAFM